MDSRMPHNISGRDQLKLFAKQVGLLLIFIVNIFTIVTSIFLINKYGLYFNHRSSNLSIVNGESKDGSVIQLYKDVDVESLIMADRLRVNSVLNDHILITSGDDQIDTPQAGIFLTQDYITMQASFIGAKSDDEFAMKLNREVDQIHVSGMCRNVRSIRSGGIIKSSQENTGIFIDSNEDELELSGNLGLQVHSRDVKLKSKEGITIESREDVIDLRSPRGLYLPNLPILDGESELSSSEAHQVGHSKRPEGHKRRQLLINKSDGLLYQVSH